MTSNRKDAMDRYTAAWIEYKTADPARQSELEKEMDSLQPLIANGPGEQWDSFKETLPGFNDFWGTLKRNCRSMVKWNKGLK